MKKNRILISFAGLSLLLCSLTLVACAGNRQGVVCDEIEYRLNTMTYSPDQRAYAEEELRVCREEEARKRGEDAASRQSIYDRFAASDSTSRGAEDSVRDVSVSEALQDSSGEKTTSIYDRYGVTESSSSESIEVPSSADVAPDTSASDISNFQ